MQPYADPRGALWRCAADECAWESHDRLPAAVFSVYLSWCLRRQSQHLPSSFILCDDKHVHWMRLNETDEDILFFWP